MERKVSETSVGLQPWITPSNLYLHGQGKKELLLLLSAEDTGGGLPPKQLHGPQREC